MAMTEFETAQIDLLKRQIDVQEKQLAATQRQSALLEAGRTEQIKSGDQRMAEQLGDLRGVGGPRLPIVHGVHRTRMLTDVGEEWLATGPMTIQTYADGTRRITLGDLDGACNDALVEIVKDVLLKTEFAHAVSEASKFPSRLAGIVDQVERKARYVVTKSYRIPVLRRLVGKSPESVEAFCEFTPNSETPASPVVPVEVAPVERQASKEQSDEAMKALSSEYAEIGRELPGAAKRKGSPSPW
jgi:hypothetical protein